MTDFPGLTFVQPTIDVAGVNIMLWGPNKSGKTTAGGTLPGPVLWLNGQGPNALGHARKVAVELSTVIREVHMPNGRDEGPVSPVLSAFVDALKTGEYRSAVVDTVGNLRDRLAQEHGGDQPSIQQWGKIAKTISRFTLALRDLPVHVLFIAHDDVSDDAEAGRIVSPLIGGKSTKDVMTEMDVIAYTGQLAQKGEPTRYVGQLVDGNGRQGLGDRSGAILDPGQSFRDLDLAEWLERYSEGMRAQAQADDLPFDAVEPQTLDEALAAGDVPELDEVA